MLSLLIGARLSGQSRLLVIVLTPVADGVDGIDIVQSFWSIRTAMLTEDQLSSWHSDGYLIIPDALSATTVQQLRAETRDMLSTFALDE